MKVIRLFGPGSGRARGSHVWSSGRPVRPCSQSPRSEPNPRGLALQPRVVVPSPSEGSSVAMSQESIAAPTAARYAAFSHGVYGCLPTLRIRRRAAGDLLDLADRGRA
jgi:hypothetical protein